MRPLASSLRMRPALASRVLVALAVCQLGCHVVVQNEVQRPGRAQRTRTRTPPTVGPPTIVLDDAGRLRFVEPLACATEEVASVQRAVERVRRPNIATFVIGIIATSAGAIALVNGVGTVNDPLAYAGGAGVAVGLPLAIGPWIRRRRDIEPLPDGPPLRRAGPDEPCGERSLAATRATLAVRGIAIHGAIDSSGTFSISPFAFVDAYERAHASLAIAATVETPSGAKQLEAIVEGGALANKRAAFLAAADFDARVEPMRLVPGIVPGALRASLSTSAAGSPRHAEPNGDAVVTLTLAIENAGPGPSYGLRGLVAAPGLPALDGRILYIGHVPRGAKVTRELAIPIAPAAVLALRDTTVELAVELRDAHGTAPTTPVRFRGLLVAPGASR